MRITVNAIDMHIEDTGESSAPALVLLHGFGTSARVWHAVLPELARTHRVVAPDLRGCGRSDHPSHGKTLSGYVADVAALITALGLDRPVVVGSSLSGTVVTRLALERPELVRGAVVVGGPGHWGEQVPELRAQIAALRRALVTDRAAATEEWVSTWFGPAVGAAARAWTARQILDSGPFIDPLLSEAAEVDDRAALPTVQVPIAFVHGALDGIPLAVPEQSAALVTGGRVEVLADVAHMPHIEAPETFTAAVRELTAGW